MELLCQTTAQMAELEETDRENLVHQLSIRDPLVVHQTTEDRQTPDLSLSGEDEQMITMSILEEEFHLQDPTIRIKQLDPTISVQNNQLDPAAVVRINQQDLTVMFKQQDLTLMFNLQDLTIMFNLQDLTIMVRIN